jgi:hypothetical protein
MTEQPIEAWSVAGASRFSQGIDGRSDKIQARIRRRC